jgi:glucose/arabinose dehydrogenase
LEGNGGKPRYILYSVGLKLTALDIDDADNTFDIMTVEDKQNEGLKITDFAIDEDDVLFITTNKEGASVLY